MNALFTTGRAMLGASALITLLACDATEKTTAPVENTPSEIGKVVFSEAFSDSGVFQILENQAGGYNSSVQARIGSQAEKLLNGSSGQPTLADVYSSLHGGSAEIPALVAKASKQIELTNPPVAPALPDPNPNIGPGPALAKTADYFSFCTGYCHDFHEGYWVYKLAYWDWWDYTNLLETLAITNDRIYGWNNTEWTATMELQGHRGAPSPNTWKPTIPPYTVNWVSWGGTYGTDTRAWARITLPSGCFGELGITEHRKVGEPH
jgi:hypothetical protein